MILAPDGDKSTSGREGGSGGWHQPSCCPAGPSSMHIHPCRGQNTCIHPCSSQKVCLVALTPKATGTWAL